jgi:hypothetical protein
MYLDDSGEHLGGGSNSEAVVVVAKVLRNFS